MTRDDIIKTAQVMWGVQHWTPTQIDRLEQFAAAQRKFDADMVDSNAMACENPIWRSLLQANADAIRNGKVDEDDEL